MHNKKNLNFSLILSAMILLSGCDSNENNSKMENPKKVFVKEESKFSKEKIAELEAELKADVIDLITNDRYMKVIDPEYHINKKYPHPANLLSVKIVDNIIKLYFDELKLTDDLILENFTSPLYTSGYSLAEKYNIENSQVELYFDGKELSDMLAKSDQEMRDIFPRKSPSN